MAEMYSTAEGQRKGPGWAKLAIWGNVPNDLKAQFGDSFVQDTSCFLLIHGRMLSFGCEGALALAPKNERWRSLGPRIGVSSAAT